MTEQSVWNKGFGKEFKPFLWAIPRKRTNAWVRVAIKRLHLKKGSKFLDCPCGPGRISIPLLKKGVRVTGIDINKDYLAEFAAKAKRAKLKVDLHHGDMRRLPFRDQFDAAANLFTSIGYFENDRDNQAVINTAFRSLKSGGRYLLDTANRDWLLRNFVSSNWHEHDGVRLLQQRTFDFKTSIERCRWTFMHDGGEETYEVPLRWFSVHEMVKMFEKAGFIDIDIFGGFDEQPVDFNSQRFFVVGRKP
jgi:ubiquinone/menaquinone biosynthesis C-methylase UbiE